MAVLTLGVLFVGSGFAIVGFVVDLEVVVSWCYCLGYGCSLSVFDDDGFEVGVVVFDGSETGVVVGWWLLKRDCYGGDETATRRFDILRFCVDMVVGLLWFWWCPLVF
ncbi:hypothetical protein QL285_012573 [Trifolium repens]|nr:hypothetical protein QL285_012573 [Trifolium repens]